MKKFVKENRTALIKILISVLFIIGAVVADIYNAQLSFILYIISYISVAYEIIFKAVTELIRKTVVSEKMLMTVASLGAIITEAYFEASLVIIIYMIGKLIEDVARDGSRKSLQTLQSIRPDKARLKDADELVNADTVKVGDIIEVYAGERIPLDGVVVSGIGSVDTSVITGESLPVDVRSGSEVFAGCLNIQSPILIEVTRELSRSAAQRIIDLAEIALDKKTKREKFINKFAKFYTPIVILCAFLVALIPTLLGGNITEWAYKAFTMLAISCPCALVISVPLAYFCAAYQASKNGILTKGAGVLEKLDSLNTVAFDKTGTLTKSDLHVTKLETTGNFTKIKLLELVCIAECKSNHPIAVAVSKEAERFKIAVKEGTNYQEKAGMGVECDSEYGHIKAGSNIFVGGVAQSSAGSVFVTLDGKYVGYVGVGDNIKKNSKKAFDQLRKLGVEKLIILSGDKKSKVDAVASALFADSAYSQLLPEKKLDAVEDIINNKPDTKIAYCGDGINDLPCLSRADVGISMGAVGSDAAIEKSDVVIMDDDIEKVPLAIKIARSAKRIATFNIAFSISAKVLILALSVLVDFSMVGAALADVGILLIAILNSLRAGKLPKNKN